ncbi:hypothetical protein ACQREA_09325 [Dietzia cinnamea]|uniref:hypothetical protein n=1 Tax=Dietzia cinnamea TaxID=321318 RepID=UPI003CFDC982
MHSRIAAALAALAPIVFLLAACSADDPAPAPTTVTTTVQASTTASSTESTSTTASSSEPPPSPTAAGPAADTCGAVGYQGAPGHESPHCLGKQIASCGTANHQTGTTFFTDGTSGWTQTCQNQMLATYVPPPPVQTFDQEEYNQQFAEEYWRTHPRPTFDPNSADGYGPDQELPPACLRLEGVDC